MIFLSLFLALLASFSTYLIRKFSFSDFFRSIACLNSSVNQSNNLICSLFLPTEQLPQQKIMCHYCCYLTHINGSSSSSTLSQNNQYYSRHSKSHRTQSYHLTMPICLVSLTLFFILLNITLVLSQSSQIQQQRQQTPHKILEENHRGKKKDQY